MISRGLRLVLVALAMCLLGRRAAAHPNHWLTARAEIRKDGTFAIDLRLDREFVSPRFGTEAPVVEIGGLPEAKDVRQETYGLLAAFVVLFDGKRVAPGAALWIPSGKEEEIRVRLTGNVPPGARTVAFENHADGPWAASVHQEGEDAAAVAMLDPRQVLDPVPLRVAPPAVAETPSSESEGRDHPGPGRAAPLGLALLVGGLLVVAAVAFARRRAAKRDVTSRRDP
jgi:hypothetical protein